MAQLDAEEAQLQQKLNSTQDYTRTEGRCPKRTVTVSREGERQQIRDAINKKVMEDPRMKIEGMPCPAGHFKFLRVRSVKFLHPRGRTW
jgi:hypothetical protein